jgi:prepilin peptidase CpaA
MLDTLNQTTVFSGSLFRLLSGGVFSVLLVIACVTDVRWRRIPNALVLTLAISGFAFSVWVNPWLIGLGGAIGAGDVKLFAAAGAWLGPAATWRAALVGAALGGLLAIAMLLRERRARQGLESVMTSISTRSLAVLANAPGRSNSRQLPYGVALACGALVVAWIPGILT